MESLKFSVEDVNIIQEVSDSQLAIAEIWVCSDGMNSHNMPISLDSIKQASSTLVNKFLVADYDGFDFLDHTKTQKILGFFPMENDFKYVEKDGKTFFVANAILSKVYAPWAYDLFLSKNYKSVSMEISVLETEEDEFGSNWIKTFVFNGVTVLGNNVNPAIEGANAQLFKFSKEDFIQEGETFMKNFAVGEKLGKDKSIDIDNSKESAIMSDTWGDPGATLLNKLLSASNHESLIKEAYLVVDGDKSSDLSINDVHYPHHSIKDGKLVVNKRGVTAAYQRLSAQHVSGEAMKHIEKHRKELGMEGGKTLDKKMAMEKFEKHPTMENYAVMDMDMGCKMAYAMDKTDKKMYAIPFDFSDEEEMDFALDGKKRVKMGYAEASDEDDDEDVYMAMKKAVEMKYTSDANVEADAQVAENKKEAEKQKEEADEDKKDDEVKMAEDAEKDEKFAEMEMKMAEIQKENDELKKFKADLEDAQEKAKVEMAAQEVEKTMGAEFATKWREKVVEFSNTDAWANAMKAEAFSVVANREPESKTFSRMDIPNLHNDSQEKTKWWKQ